MRRGRYVVVLASVGVLAAGCGTKVQPDNLTAAVTSIPLARFAHRWAEISGELPGWHPRELEPRNPLEEPVATNNDGPGWPNCAPARPYARSPNIN